MEFIFGVIEDLLEKLESDNIDEAEDAKHSLKININQFIKNLEDFIREKNGNKDKASKLLEKL